MLHRYFRIQMQRRGEFKPQRGFTAIELMVVVAILAILTALALPSFTHMVKRYRVKRAVEDFASTLHLARVEGIKRGGGVILAKTSSSGCVPDTTQDWSCGWVLYADTNANGKLDKGEEIQISPAPSGVDVMVYPQYAKFQFDRWGDGNSSGQMKFNLQAKDGAGDTTTGICVSSGNRIRLAPGGCS